MRLSLTFLFACTVLTSACLRADEQVVSSAEAAKYEGKVTRVHGRVIEVRRVAGGPVIFEIDGKPTAPRFRALVYPMAVERFGSDPEKIYLGAEVMVTGLIVVRKDLPQAWINDPTHIRLWSKDKTDAAPSATPAP